MSGWDNPSNPTSVPPPHQQSTNTNNNYGAAPLGLVTNHQKVNNNSTSPSPFIPSVPYGAHGLHSGPSPIDYQQHHQHQQHGPYGPPGAPHHHQQILPQHLHQQLPPHQYPIHPISNNIHGQPPPGVIIPPPNAQYQPLRLPVNSPISPGGGGLHHAVPTAPGGTNPIPVPQTPQGVPLANPFANGPENDLPPQLLELGWKKFWSKRENRWYFWNCNSGESLWEVPPFPRPPVAPGQYDPLTDPLGITHSHTQNPNLKRRASSGEHMGSPTVKKFILMGPWDLEVVSNVYSSETSIPQPHLLPPHPEIEQTRSQLVAKLRQCYQQSCKSREGIDAPKDSLNRWMLERKVAELRGLDPVFPSCESADGTVSPVMLREIMNDIPMKVIKPRFTGDARKQLAKYADSCKRTIETRSTSADARKLVKWKVEETFTWLRTTVGAPYEALQERMTHLKEICQPHVHDAARSSVEGICRKMSALSKQYAKNVQTAHLKLFLEPQNVKTEYEPEKGKFRCQPAICGPFQFIESHSNTVIDFTQPDRDHAILKFKNEPIRITTQYLQKLEQVYRYNCVEDRKFESFLLRTYSLLKRYNAYCEDFSHPHNSQGSLPVPVFESIQRNFGVTFECFASPLNCYFRQYCSAFPDTDCYYGSRGTFLDYRPVAGSFEMNPPFSEELIDASITHAEELLSGAQDSMSFMIFVPDLSESKDDVEIDCPWIKRLENSRWKRKQITIPAYEHEFRHGAQHLVPKSDASVRSTNPTIIFWLQNESGFEEWKPTEQRVDALIEAYKPGRERERDRQDLLSPERQNPQLADKQVAAVAAGLVTPIMP